MEESITEIIQSLINDLEGVDPEVLSPELTLNYLQTTLKQMQSLSEKVDGIDEIQQGILDALQG